MKIETVTVCYGELRSKGYPSYSNERYELTLQAKLEEGDKPREIKDRLTQLAKDEVRTHFGDNISQTELDIPF